MKERKFLVYLPSYFQTCFRSSSWASYRASIIRACFHRTNPCPFGFAQNSVFIVAGLLFFLLQTAKAAEGGRCQELGQDPVWEQTPINEVFGETRRLGILYKIDWHPQSPFFLFRFGHAQAQDQAQAHGQTQPESETETETQTQRLPTPVFVADWVAKKILLRHQVTAAELIEGLTNLRLAPTPAEQGINRFNFSVRLGTGRWLLVAFAIDYEMQALFIVSAYSRTSSEGKGWERYSQRKSVQSGLPGTSVLWWRRASLSRPAGIFLESY